MLYLHCIIIKLSHPTYEVYFQVFVPKYSLKLVKIYSNGPVGLKFCFSLRLIFIKVRHHPSAHFPHSAEVRRRTVRVWLYPKIFLFDFSTN